MLCRGFASSALPEHAPPAAAAAAPTPKAARAAAAAPLIDVQKYVRDNVTPYDGPADFLAVPTKRTLELWDQVQVGGRNSGCLGWVNFALQLPAFACRPCSAATPESKHAWLPNPHCISSHHSLPRYTIPYRTTPTPRRSCARRS